MGNEKEKLKAPLPATLYGFPVYYRIEMRAGKETLILSYRSEDTGKIEYEASPVRVQGWDAMTEGCFSAEPKNALMFEALLDKTQAVSRFCVGFVGIGSAAEAVKNEECEKEIQKLLELRREHRKNQFLPLGILLLADWKEYLEFSPTKMPPKEATKQDRIRALERLQRHEAYTLWPKVTPEKCSSWLALLSEHEAKSTVRLIQYLFTIQKMLDPDIDDPWAKYLPVDGRKPPSQRALVAQHNERISLTDGQCAEIFKRCEEHYLNGKVNSTEFAVLLLMTAPISLEELCALTYQDFCYLRDYRSRLTLKISNEYAERGSEQNFHLRKIENKYQKRTIPMARLIAAYYEALLRKANIPSLSRDPDVLKGMYVFSAVNKDRRATPLYLENQISRYMAPWIPKSIAKSNESKTRKPITTLRLLQNTALYHMSSIGYEAEEIRRMQGMAPKLVSAKSYQDFVNEAELNKLGSLTDCWIQRVYHFPPNVYQAFFGEKKIKLLLPEAASGQSEAMIKISIPPMEQDKIPAQGVAIRLSALAGLSGTISHTFDDQGGTQ